jgi:hypothetical protein
MSVAEEPFGGLPLAQQWSADDLPERNSYNWYSLIAARTCTDGGDSAIREVNTFHGHLDTQSHCREWEDQAFLNHRVEAGQLLILAIGIHDDLFDQLVQIRLAKLSPSPNRSGPAFPPSIASQIHESIPPAHYGCPPA